MKRSWFGAGLLAALLILSLLSGRLLSRCHQPAARDLEEAAQTALAGDWSRTADLTRSARSRWERCRHFSAAITDHAPMEQIDRLFAILEVHQHTRSSPDTAALCAELAQRIRRISQDQQCSWWDIL